MSSIQPQVHSFIVKIWLDDTAPTAGRYAWRGRITHVPSGRQQHFVNLAEIPSFITPYLEQPGVKLTWFAQFRRWWQQRSRRYR